MSGTPGETRKYSFVVWFGLLLALLWLIPQTLPAMEWPRTIDSREATIVVYQPQLETFADDTLTSRAAVSVTEANTTEPVFGAVWFRAKVATDLSERLVTMIEVSVTAARFPEVDTVKVERLSAFLGQEITGWDIVLSLDDLLASLETAERERTIAEGLNTEPPAILFESQPTVLVLIDGEPKLIAVENSSLMRVANTPHLLLLDSGEGAYYLAVGDEWYSAAEISGEWSPVPEPSKEVKDLIARAEEENPQPEQPAESKGKSPSKILVRTEPTELISSEGEPEYSPLSGTGLLYMSNTDSDLLMEIASQRLFVLISGRWYSADSLAGPWSYVAADELPADFARIPVGSAKEHVLSSVAGTREAQEALLEAEIPQTAAVAVKDASVEVDYDGEPKFEEIEGTDMEYAVNTAYSVVKVSNQYYCCHDAVWFVSSDPGGPWAVCVDVPDVIYTIPPSCPVYNVSYVKVYSHTPDVVYVGYTPGYIGCYPYGPTIVYGTGYVYPAWYGSVYYPRPVTWGFAVRYNPYYGGWSVGVRVSGPHGSIIIRGGGGYGGWHGPPGYRPVYVNHHTHVHNVNINVNNSRNVYHNRNDIYRTQIENERRPSADQPVNRGGTKPSSRNDVFADKQGNVYRSTDKGWQTRDQSGWKSSDQAGSAHQGQMSDRNKRSLDRQKKARDRGASRTSNFQKSGKSGMRSGGGGRRRR
jgi:hypothetical protein